MAKLRKVRWGHVHELDKRIHVGTEVFRRRYPPRLQKLAAWRNLHRTRTHKQVSRIGRKYGAKPSSNMTLRQMVAVGRAG